MAMQRRVGVGPVELEVLEAGEGGGPLLLVHGFTGAKEDFADHVDDLAAAGWHVVAPDQRGHGRSDAPADEAAYDLGVLGRRRPAGRRGASGCWRATCWPWSARSGGAASSCSATRWAGWWPSSWRCGP